MEGVRILRHRVDLGRIELFYRDTEVEGPVIVCLHGRWGRGETWADFMLRYGRNYRVIAPDQRGHGLSGKPLARYSAEEFSEDLLALLDRLGIASAFVVGHSMGGHVAGWFGAHHPERVAALAILDKSAAGPRTAAAPDLARLPAVDPLSKDWPLPFPSLREAMAFLKAELESELSYQYFMNSLVETDAGYGFLFSPQAIAANIAHYADWFELLPRLGVPVMLLRAAGGGAVSDEDFKRMRESIPRCCAFEMSKTDHNVHLSDPAEFYRCFDSFLTSLGGEWAERIPQASR